MSKEVSSRVEKLRALSGSFRKPRTLVARIENYCKIESARGQWSAKLVTKQYEYFSDVAKELGEIGYAVEVPGDNSYWTVSWDDQ